VPFLKCDRCGRRVPYVIEWITCKDGSVVSVKNPAPTIKTGYAIICFRCARKAKEQEAARGN
jgi:hypothetical protein